MKGEDQWRRWKMATWSVTEPNSVFTNPVCPLPWKPRPCIETAWLSADRPVSAAALWYREWGVKEEGRMATKAFCCSLGVRLPALLSAVGSNFTYHLDVHAYTYGKISAKPHTLSLSNTLTPIDSCCRSLRGKKCACGSSGGQMRFVCQAFRARQPDKSSHITKVLGDR